MESVISAKRRLIQSILYDAGIRVLEEHVLPSRFVLVATYRVETENWSETETVEGIIQAIKMTSRQELQLWFSPVMIFGKAVECVTFSKGKWQIVIHTQGVPAWQMRDVSLPVEFALL